ERVTSLMSMSELEESLPASQFLRIHRSFLVAKEQVVMQLGNKLILQDGTELPIGRTYKKAGLQALFE
ncbi:MAG: LytTR family DNA-binding domain-containing protein, partial [Bacteroidota bacterium]